MLEGCSFADNIQGRQKSQTFVVSHVTAGFVFFFRPS
jgi:hypothetical protein